MAAKPIFEMNWTQVMRFKERAKARKMKLRADLGATASEIRAANARLKDLKASGQAPRVSRSSR